MNKIFCMVIGCVIFLAFVPLCLAEDIPANPSTTSINPSQTNPSTTAVSEPAADTNKKYHLEIGGNYNWLNHGYGTWKALDVRFLYSGFRSITPFGSVALQNRREGSQYVYGAGSYIDVHPKFYLITGLSGAPVRDPDVILYPRLRMDLAGFYKAAFIDGLILSTGITHFPKQNGNGGDIIAAGGIYYIGRAVFSGSLNYNIAQPGNVTSLSGQTGVMYGTEGKYWLGGGIATGRVAYQLASTIPLDVRYESRAFNIFGKKWIGTNWGLIGRYDYQDLRGAYELNGITLSVFVDF
jgi:YaiO family outer membrane protein